MTPYELAEFDRIKNDVYAIINNGERGVLISNFDAANEVVTNIAKYVTGNDPAIGCIHQYEVANNNATCMVCGEKLFK